MVELKERIQRIGLFVKSALFTIVIHATLLAILLVGRGLFPKESIKRGATEPIQAQVISTDYIEQKKAVKLEQEAEKKRLEAEKKKKREQENKQLETEKERKIAAEKKKRLEAEKERKQEVEKKQLEAEKQRKQEAEKKRLEAEKKREQENKRLEAEKERKIAAENKRLEAEKERKIAAENKRLEADKERKIAAEKKRLEDKKKKKREQELKEKLEEERILQQLAQTELDATTALSALADRIAITVEKNWRRPLNSATGLEVTINVKVSRNGDVLLANVVKSSGDLFFDQSAERAVKKASPLPFPSNPKYYEFIDDFNIKFNPDDE